MKRLHISPTAKTDIRRIGAYIKEENPDAALSLLNAFNDKFRMLVLNPKTGRIRPEFPGDLRSFSASRYVIFYRVTEDTVEIVRVLHGARDLPSILSPDDDEDE